MADGGAAPQITTAVAGADGAVVLRERYTVYPGRPLPDLNSPNALAYAVEDRRGGRPLFALALSPDLPVRLATIQSMRGQQFSSVLALIDYGFAFWQPLGRETMIVLFERPSGGRLVASLDETFQPLSDPDYQKIILRPLVQGMEELKGRGVVHRAIRPTNIFFMDAERTRPVIGECISAPPGFDQPTLCEPLESAMALPEGRGTGSSADDMYALGVTLLYILIGRRPGGQNRGRDLIRARIANGSFTALTGDARFPIAMIEVLRGLLIDDSQQRWDLEAMKLWVAGRRLSPILAKPEKRAQRAFRIGGQEVMSRRDLALALADHWDQAAQPVMEGLVEVWLRRALDEKEAAEAVAELVRQASFPGASNSGMTTDSVIARVCLRLDPHGPIRFKGARFLPEGLGPALAVASTRGKDVRAIVESLLREMPEAWFEVQTTFDPANVSLISQIKQIRSYLRQPQPGFGVERCLYELNESLPCLSPLVASEYVLEIEDLLPALDRAAKRVDAKSWPADRHIVAFVAARFRFDVEKQIAALNSPQADTSALGLLSLLAVLQWKLGPETLPGLSGWIGALVAPIIASYHNRDVRKRLEKEVPKLVRKGSLPDLYNALDDVEERQKDLDGFAWAKAEFAGAEQEILDMEADAAHRETQAQRIGQQSAAVVSVMIGLITVCVFLALQVW
ncbi:Serine/threonine protein kinase [uncultured Alphaproteobacteria bacterium]|uniref:Serine/threonine protein kinase n=1 Tax=uncultured Alphaproteobacteria bacterium TaxID=91750 RepID=A0A212JBU5_9PROT|nr:Serine/threonine protein kinase [uncultured Alphaproteobacteria bacterium]